MERKTIGGFIAVLRKANGYTQKDLSEKLNVSDKTISRWERDEGTPDLSLIPVIAEIFGITSDELLRGERNAAESMQIPDLERQNTKTEKQRQRLMTRMRSAYQTRSFISVGLAGVGLIAAMIANFGFNRAYIGFLGGAVFFLIAIVCQAVFINKAFLAITGEDVHGKEVENYKRVVATLGMKVITIILTVLGSCLPLILYPKDTYVGIIGSTWLSRGLIFGTVSFVLCSIFCHFFTASLLKQNVYVLTEKQSAIYRHNFKLKGSCALVLTVLLLVTFTGHAALTGGWDAFSIMAGTSFDDWESFKAYMEQDIPTTYNYRSEQAEEIASETYFDEYGNVITEEEALRRTLTDKDGKILCEYIDRNHSVSSIRYGHINGKQLPVIVYTLQDLYDGSERIEVINRIFIIVYLVEATGVILLYFKKRC